jgi:hypothetical protein
VAPITPTPGVHDVYLTFSGGNSVGDIKWFKFSRTPRDAADAEIPAKHYDAMLGIRDHEDKIGYLDEGKWVRYGGVDFGAEPGTTKFAAELACPANRAGNYIEVRLDSPTAPPVAQLKVKSTRSWDVTGTQSTPMSPTCGLHDVYLTFRGGRGVADLYSIRFSR